MSNKNFTWRPNDFTSSTLLKYSQEATHWTKAFKSAGTSVTSASASLSESLGVIGAVISLFFVVIGLLIIGIGELLTWLFAEKPYTEADYYKDLAKLELERRAQYREMVIKKFTKNGKMFDLENATELKINELTFEEIDLMLGKDD